MGNHTSAGTALSSWLTLLEDVVLGYTPVRHASCYRTAICDLQNYVAGFLQRYLTRSRGFVGSARAGLLSRLNTTTGQFVVPILVMALTVDGHLLW